MAQNKGAELITSSRAVYLNPEKDVQLEKTKTEINEKAAKIIKLIKTRNQRKKGGGNITNSEIIALVEDFHKQYLSLHAIHDDLRQDLKERVRVREDNDELEDEGPFTNAEDSYFSADERSISSSPGRRLSDDFYLKTEIPSAEILDLKNKLASISAEKEALNSEYMASLSKIQESEKIIESLKVEAAASPSKIQESKNIIESLKIKTEEKECEKQKLLDEISQLKEKCAENEKKSVSLREELEVRVREAKTREENLETQISSLKLELENLCSGKGDIQEQLDIKVAEAKQLGEENSILQTRIEELEKVSEEKEGRLSKMDKLYLELSDFRNQAADLKKIVDNTTMDLQNARKAKEDFERQVKELEQKVDFITSEKIQLEMQIEKKIREAEQARADNEELHDRISQLEKSEKKRSDELAAIQIDLEGLENVSSVKIKSSKEEVKKLQETTKLNLKLLERKIEDTAEGFYKEFEDKIRILSRRIRVAEQLHMENKEIYINTKEKYEKEHDGYKDMIGSTEVAVKMMRGISLTANQILDKSDTAAIQFNEQSENFLNRLSKASCEVLFARDWIRRKNEALKNFEEDADILLLEMGKKESEILGLRERVWKSENRVRELEKIVKEKDDGMLSVGEEKREAIRQLCVWIEYHRSRCDSLKKILSDMTAARRQRIA